MHFAARCQPAVILTRDKVPSKDRTKATTKTEVNETTPTPSRPRRRKGSVPEAFPHPKRITHH